METSDYKGEASALKSLRDKLLAFHKLLIDRERKEIEKQSGALTAGQFLGQLMNDEKFTWLRTISKLVVNIDEAFELDDGMPPVLIRKYKSEIVAMFDDSDEHDEFKLLVAVRMETMPAADKIRNDIREQAK